jgi:Tol biopolymer transport system component
LNGWSLRPPDYRDALLSERSPLGEVLYRGDLITGERQALLTPESFGSSETRRGMAAWSPSDKSICFQTETVDPADRGERYSIYWMDLKTTVVRRIAAASAPGGCSVSRNDGETNWFDGRCLMVAATRGGPVRQAACRQVAQQDLGQARRRMRLFAWSRSAGWSPRGRSLAWPAVVDDRVELSIIDRQSGTHRVAWSGASGFRSVPTAAKWSRDGSLIAIKIRRPPSTELWEIGVPPRDEQQLAQGR